MVYAVVHHWVSLVGEVREVRRTWGKEVLHHTYFLYEDGGLVASKDPVFLQGAFDTFTGLFDRVGIWKNVRKTVGMICRPCSAVGTQSDTA